MGLLSDNLTLANRELSTELNVPRGCADLMVRDLGGFVGPVLLFGGTFDPPHLGHVRAACAAQACFPGAPLVLVPTAKNPLKANGPEADAAARLEMLVALAAGETDMKVCPLQLSGSVPNYTVGLLRALKEASPLSTPVLILGSDCITDLSKWREIQELPRLAKPLIVVREGEPEVPSLIKRASLSPELRGWLERALVVGPVGTVSSSQVRFGLKVGKVLSQGRGELELVPVAVAEVIRAKGLYSSNSSEIDLS